MTQLTAQQHLERLRTLIPSPETLKKQAHVLLPLSQDEIEAKKKCLHCKKTIKQYKPKGRAAEETKQESGDEIEQFIQSRRSLNHLAVAQDIDGIGESANPEWKSGRDENTKGQVESGKKPALRCKFHPGTVASRRWTCCQKPVYAPHCSGNEDHIMREYSQADMKALWTFYPTPEPWPGSSQIREAVAIDCEMGQAEDGDSELIRVTLVDYFTSNVLIDSLVYPRVRMAHYNTRFSGVTRAAMEQSKAYNRCIMGRDAARQAVWRFVGPNTVVLGHAISNDLRSLRWIHPVVVDSFIIEYKLWRLEEDAKLRAEEIAKKEAKKLADTEDQQSINPKAQTQDVAKGRSRLDPEEEDVSDNNTEVNEEDNVWKSLEATNLGQGSNATDRKDEKTKRKVKGSGRLSLKTLSLTKLGRVIQSGHFGHDSLEDAIAARDVIQWYVINHPTFEPL